MPIHMVTPSLVDFNAKLEDLLEKKEDVQKRLERYRKDKLEEPEMQSPYLDDFLERAEKTAKELNAQIEVFEKATEPWNLGTVYGSGGQRVSGKDATHPQSPMDYALIKPRRESVVRKDLKQLNKVSTSSSFFPVTRLCSHIHSCLPLSSAKRPCVQSTDPIESAADRASMLLSNWATSDSKVLFHHASHPSARSPSTMRKCISKSDAPHTGLLVIITLVASILLVLVTSRIVV